MKTEPEKNIAIETNNISKSFEGKLVISKLNLKIFHGFLATLLLEQKKAGRWLDLQNYLKIDGRSCLLKLM